MGTVGKNQTRRYFAEGESLPGGTILTSENYCVWSSS